MSTSFNFSGEIKGDTFYVVFEGALDGDLKLRPLGKEAKASGYHIQMDMSGITRIGSMGIKCWLDFLYELDEMQKVTLLNCPNRVIEAINLVYYLSVRCQILSFYAPYICDSCEHTKEIFYQVEEIFPELKENMEFTIPIMECPNCKNEEMELDDIEEEYFRFLKLSLQSKKAS